MVRFADAFCASCSCCSRSFCRANLSLLEPSSLPSRSSWSQASKAAEVSADAESATLFMRTFLMLADCAILNSRSLASASAISFLNLSWMCLSDLFFNVKAHQPPKVVFTNIFEFPEHIVINTFCDFAFCSILYWSIDASICSSSHRAASVLWAVRANRSTRLPMLLAQLPCTSRSSPTSAAASTTVAFNICCMMPLSPSSTIRCTSFESPSSRATRTRVAVETISWSCNVKCSKERRN
mmetsp:Transcript_65628/g.201064  ORF Transcript_65628/g.201064 Transcript_65628/m.201064 type:complete len:239 (-) Transcript_65628:359-1075(-)